MCLFSAPKVPKVPAPAQMQAMQTPKDLMANRNGANNRLRRRGMWASIFTSPQGVTTAPTVTGGGGSVTGG